MWKKDCAYESLSENKKTVDDIVSAVRCVVFEWMYTGTANTGKLDCSTGIQSGIDAAETNDF